MLQPLRCLEVLTISLFLCYFFLQAISSIILQSLFVQEVMPSNPFIILVILACSISFSSLFKAKWGSNKHTHTQMHNPQSQASQDESFRQNPFLAADEIIIGLSLPFSSLVNSPSLPRFVFSHFCPIIFNGHNGSLTCYDIF